MEPGAPASTPAPPAPVHLPDAPALFERRAARLDALAAGHSAPEWLRLLARIARGQAAAVRQVSPSSPPAAAGEGRGAGAPLAAIPRDGGWRRMLPPVLDVARDPGLPAAARDAIAWLAAAPPDHLDALADAVLAGAVPRERLACAPFVGAALQAWLAARAALLEGAPFPAGAPGDACPACGGPPVAGVVAAEDRLRWLTCAWCATAWNVPRVRCVACETATGPEYLHVDGFPGAKAEACPDCRAYLKLFDLRERPGAEAAADDAATLALDLLLAEEGFHRIGPNPAVGAGEAAAPVRA